MTESLRYRTMGVPLSTVTVNRPEQRVTEKVAQIMRKHRIPLATGKWADYEAGCEALSKYVKLNDELKERVAQWTNVK